MVMLLELVSTILPKYHINKLYLVISHPWRIPHASSLPVQAYLDGKCTTCSCNMSYSISMAMYKRWSQNFWITWLLSHFVESFKWNVIPYPATHTHTYIYTSCTILNLNVGRMHFLKALTHHWQPEAIHVMGNALFFI